jgi:hypothetical protein
MKNFDIQYMYGNINQVEVSDMNSTFVIITGVLIITLILTYYFYFNNKSQKIQDNFTPNNDTIPPHLEVETTSISQHSIEIPQIPTIEMIEQNNISTKSIEELRSEIEKLQSELPNQLDIPFTLQQWTSKDELLNFFEAKCNSLFVISPENTPSKLEDFVQFVSKINENVVLFSKELENDKENRYQLADLKQQGLILEKMKDVFVEIDKYKENTLANLKKYEPNVFYNNLQQYKLSNHNIKQNLKCYLNLQEDNDIRIQQWTDKKNSISQFLLDVKIIWDKLQSYPFSNFVGIENNYKLAAKEINLSIVHFDKASDLQFAEIPKVEAAFEELNTSYTLLHDAKIKLQDIINRYEKLQHYILFTKSSLPNLQIQVDSEYKKIKYKNEDVELRFDICIRNLKEADKSIKSLEFVIAQEFLKKVEENFTIAKEIAFSLKIKIEELRNKLESTKRKANEEIEEVQHKYQILKSSSNKDIDEKFNNLQQSIDIAHDSEAKVDISNYQSAENSLKLAILRYEQSYHLAKQITY